MGQPTARQLQVEARIAQSKDDTDDYRVDGPIRQTSTVTATTTTTTNTTKAKRTNFKKHSLCTTLMRTDLQP
ncbi:unnamed protein product [Rotaria sp. Silwood2]|nr:unnamed protein product [Rotaria sp. Silwood2]CAF3151469.1 unnamed protein product [Rotaria sp. Silwood2]CAF4493253.1 unnamed protein product [Rotaria sp. Silwood2]CAF4582356.1 unnamed protein product [Rotaria sp. Silwood2]